MTQTGEVVNDCGLFIEVWLNPANTAGKLRRGLVERRG
jgi:hypothetical protein